MHALKPPCMRACRCCVVCTALVPAQGSAVACYAVCLHRMIAAIRATFRMRPPLPTWRSTLSQFQFVPQSRIIAAIRATYVPDETFTPGLAKRASPAAEGLCKWVHAMSSYDKVGTCTVHERDNYIVLCACACSAAAAEGLCSGCTRWAHILQGGRSATPHLLQRRPFVTLHITPKQAL